VKSNFINIKSCFAEVIRPMVSVQRFLAIIIIVSGWVFTPTSAIAKLKEDQIIPQASNTRLGGDKQRTRFVVDISSSIGYAVYVLPDPYRVIIDLPEVYFQLPPGQGLSGRGRVTGYRFGLFSPGRSRIVIDTSAPVLIQKSFVIPAKNQKPARLVVDIVKTDIKTFLRNRKSQLKAQSNAAKLGGIPIPVPRPRGSIMPGFNKKTDRVSKKRAKKTIIIDPGHGGIDSGAVDPRGEIAGKPFATGECPAKTGQGDAFGHDQTVQCHG
jgi:N-acetylmuramoyl-L-alanine amidase